MTSLLNSYVQAAIAKDAELRETLIHFLNASFSSLLPFPLSFIDSLLRAIVHALVLNLLYFGLTEGQFQFMRLLQSKGYLTRAQVHHPKGRDLLQVFTGATSVTLPISLLQHFNASFVSRISIYTWPTVLEVLATQLLMYAVVDTWYFFGHRHSE